MSSMWDFYGFKFYDGTLKFEEIAELVEFLRGFDEVHDGMVGKALMWHLSPAGYTWHGYDQFLVDLQNKGMSKQTLEYFLGELHTFDHEHKEILMYSFGKDKNYWSKHRVYESRIYGTFKEGKWETE